MSSGTEAMDPQYYGLIEMAFSFGLVLAFGIWQLVSLRRSKKDDEKK